MIRKHTEDDLEQLLTIWSLSSTKAHPFLKKEFVEKVSSDMRNLYMPNTETWVYEVEGEIIGFVSMMDNEIGGLFVLPDNMGKGIGRQLVDFVSKSHKVLEVEVFEKNEIGRAFYDKYGFQAIKEFIHEESGENVLRMRK